MKPFRLTHLRVAVSALVLGLGAGASAFFMSAKPAYACAPGGGGSLGNLLDIIGRIFGW
jgi:hypothetical protein